MSRYEDGYWESADGLRLHYRDYAGRADRPPILCLAGLTRNARDYESVAERLAGDWRVIAIDFRGRGKSYFAKDPMSYVPATYAGDVAGLIAELGIEHYVAFGTSLGGIVTMLLAHRGAEGGRGRIVGALLNDVGPEIDPAGLSRIRSYVGRSQTWPTWLHAARAVADGNAHVYPDWEIAGWLAMAKRLYRLNSSGRIVLDYDMKIAEPFRAPGGEQGPDMWQALAALKGVPTLVLRGATSDVLSAKTAARMKKMLGPVDLVTVAGVGHTPTLDEPQAIAAIDRLLDRVAREPVAT
ncbi:MAG: alpha/beta hydrolase [Pseudomonadota bacterium]|nr:alpha/beta hydrolase [Pseudomonadota bacterium]